VNESLAEFRVAWLAFWATVAEAWRIDRACRVLDRALSFLDSKIRKT